jgi:hypothetical protein
MHERELPQRAGMTGADITEAEQERGAEQGKQDAEAVDQAPDQHAPRAEAHHGERVGQRGIGARDGEVRLHRRQRDHEGPHADAADGADRQRRGKARPRIGGFDAFHSLGPLVFLCGNRRNGRGGIIAVRRRTSSQGI